MARAGVARAGVGSRNPTAFALPDQRLESEEYPCPGLACMGRGGKGKSAEAVRHIVVWANTANLRPAKAEVAADLSVRELGRWHHYQKNVR